MKPTDADDLRYLKGLTVLYVEDDDDTRARLAEFLARRVRRVLVASDGAAGLADYRAFRPDLVITDIQMPPMDGLTMARLIRELDDDVPILVTTAFDQTEYLTRAIEIGVETYVMKPIDGQRLHAALLGCARRLRLEAEAEHRRALESDLQRAQTVAALAAGMAHDYNNLLQTVLGNVSLARETLAPDAPEAPLLEEAEEAATEASALGAMLMRLAHRGPPPLATTALEPALRPAAEEALAGRALALSVSIDPGCPPVAIEDTELRLVVRHLVANACDAMPDGGTLTLTAELAVDPGTTTIPLAPGSYVRLVVRDTGRGVTPEVLSRMFEPYFTTKERTAWRGVGLGLTVTRAIVEHYRGAVYAELLETGVAVHVLVPVAPKVPSA
jgi:signal transduction histidine kinase